MTTRRPQRGDGGGPRHQPRRAFTLTELLVVIVILVLVTAIAVPAFRSIMYSSEATLAQTRLAAAIKAGRDAALQSTPGADTAAVFFFEPGEGMQVLICVRVGELLDQGPPLATGGGAGQPQLREIFVPVQTIEPFQLPRNWMVRGYVPWQWIDAAGGHWYGPTPSAPVRYGSQPGVGDWVFPETGFFDKDRADDGNHRQTFMIRFQGGTGAVASTSNEECLVLSPRRNFQNRPTAANQRWLRADLATDYRRFVRTILMNPQVGTTGTPTQQQALLGNISSDTVLARPVAMLALYDEEKLAAAVGMRLDRVTGSLYADLKAPQFLAHPSWSQTQLAQRMNWWINGDTNFSGGTVDRATGDIPEARIYTLNRLTGDLRLVEIEQ